MRTGRRGVEYLLESNTTFCNVGVSYLSGKRPQSLLWAGTRATRLKVTKSFIRNPLNYFSILMLSVCNVKKFAAGRGLDTRGRTVWRGAIYCLHL